MQHFKPFEVLFDSTILELDGVHGHFDNTLIRVPSELSVSEGDDSREYEHVKLADIK